MASGSSRLNSPTPASGDSRNKKPTPNIGDDDCEIIAAWAWAGCVSGPQQMKKIIN
jgi:hypothetical protein